MNKYLIFIKKNILLVGEKLRFFFLTFLTALVIIVLGISILNKIIDSLEVSIQQPYSYIPSLENYFGHFPYSENKQQNLVKVADFYGREEFLARTAATAFNRMKLDAKASGVNLTLISGFRSRAQQEKLFLKQINKQGSKEAAARLSAPPGYSEHHTGYALDIGEDQNIDTFIKFEFENTEAYRWLEQNAHKYGFELSFPKNNLQGVSYEPWHWRFVNSQKAQEIFRRVKSHTAEIGLN